MAYSMGSGFEQGQLQVFEKNFIRVAHQTDSLLLKTPAVQFKDIKGISNLATMDSTELTEVTDKGSNPDKVYQEMGIKNRRSVQRRFTKTYLFDDYDKCVNLITDPTSDLFLNLKEAFNRKCDKCIADAASAAVIIGAPNAAGTSVSAANDGVITIAGTTSFSYEKVISKGITTFKNNYIDCSTGTTLAIAGTEEEALRNDEKYMNALYSSNNTVDKGTITNASGFHVVTFAGSENGGTTVTDPVLTEADGVRTNLLLAPQAIAFAVEIGRLDCTKSATKVNSYEVTIDMWVKAVRRDGKRVILITSTI